MSVASLKRGLVVMTAGLALGIPSAAAARRPTAPPPPPPSQANLDEWNLIKLTSTDVAAAQGGAGVTVAVMDGLTDCRHVDLTTRCENFQIDGGRYRFYGNHGTHVAGIVAGAQTGVAPSAHILNYAVFDDRRYVANESKLINAWLDASARGATITNMSFGCTGLALCFTAAEVGAMASAGLSSMLFVKAAGNDDVNLANESVAVSGDAARDAMARLMLVGSLELSGAMSSYSNRPGETCLLPTGASGCVEGLKWKYYFIVAPGSSIYSTLPGGSYGYMSGTSMAAPVVAGAAALLQNRWPALKADPETTALILFDTASDLGAPGVDAVYGWGLLNVTAAFQAQGTVNIVRSDGGTTPVTGTTLTGSPTFSGLASVLGEVTVYDKYGRDFALKETGALRLLANPYPTHERLGSRLLAQGTQADWATALFAPSRMPSGYLRYGSPGELARNPFSPDRHARMGVDLPFKGGAAQFRMTGASTTRVDFAHDPSLKPLSFFASTALLDSSVLGHGLVRLSGKSSLSFYAARSIDPIAADAEDVSRMPHLAAERQVRLLSQSAEQDQRKNTIGLGYWLRPDSRTVVGLNASVIDQAGGWYDLSFDTPGADTATRIVNLGALASRRFGPWEVSAAAEYSHVRTSGGGLFSFTPAGLVSAEASITRKGLFFSGPAADSLALAVTVPPRAVSGSLSIDQMTRTADGLGRQSAPLRYSLSNLGAESPKVEAAYRVEGGDGWSLGVAGGLNIAGEARGGEVLADMRVKL